MTTTFTLKKGGSFNLVKSIGRVQVGLGWDVSSRPGVNFDLDASAFGLIHTGQGVPKFYGEGSHAVCYANTALKQKDGSFETADKTMRHFGDNRTGAGEGDDEVIAINLAQLPAEIVEVAVFVTIYEHDVRKQDFGAVNSTFIRVLNADTQQELCRYDMQKEFAGQTAVQVGSFIKENNTWSFKAVGVGSAAGLGDILEQYQ